MVEPSKIQALKITISHSGAVGVAADDPYCERRAEPALRRNVAYD